MSHAAEPQSAQGLRIADPTPIGLICLAIGCAALVPIAFGAALTPAGLKTAAMFCLLFGAGGQLVAGLSSLLNRNVYGGTLFTSFAFNWVVNWWALDSLSRGEVPDATIVFAVDVCFLAVFLVFTYGFGFFSSLLWRFSSTSPLPRPSAPGAAQAGCWGWAEYRRSARRNGLRTLEGKPKT